ncbi:hypothetical protein [Deinococcus kurensis]|uniref:hypothetical protein n=1 Tax=Deinococcus kurensis TaxID=2662757 RepID=UPI0012D2D2EB|nr:hypothetical protein [Deinococcus kurensis]
MFKLPETPAELAALTADAAVRAAEYEQRAEVAATMLAGIPALTPALMGFTPDQTEKHRAKARGLYTIAQDESGQYVLAFVSVQTSEKAEQGSEVKYIDIPVEQFKLNIVPAARPQADGTFRPFDWLARAISKANGTGPALTIAGGVSAADALAAVQAKKGKKGKAE